MVPGKPGWAVQAVGALGEGSLAAALLACCCGGGPGGVLLARPPPQPLTLRA